MKKLIVYIVLVASIFVIIVALVIYKSIIREDLPHGAVMHIMPASKDNNVHSALILCPGGGYASLAKWREGYMWFPYLHQAEVLVVYFSHSLLLSNYSVGWY